jgi:hypothetical protein
VTYDIRGKDGCDILGHSAFGSIYWRSSFSPFDRDDVIMFKCEEKMTENFAKTANRKNIRTIEASTKVLSKQDQNSHFLFNIQDFCCYPGIKVTNSSSQ